MSMPGGCWSTLRYNEPGGLVASVRPGRRSGELKASLAFRSPAVIFDHRDRAAQKRLMTQRFSGSGWEIPRLLLAMRDSPDFVLDNFAQVRMDTWSRCRIALLGDAAWCPAGFAPKSSAYIALRAMSMRTMTHWPVKNLIASQFAKANDLQLPDYEQSGIR